MDTIVKVLALLKSCPTCSRPLVAVKGTTILRCTDLYHGRFVVEQTTQGHFFITYEPKQRSVS
jgi:hypothetical protein